MEITVDGGKGIPLTFKGIHNGLLPLKKLQKVFPNAIGLSYKRNNKIYPIFTDDEEDSLKLEDGIENYNVLVSGASSGTSGIFIIRFFSIFIIKFYKVHDIIFNQMLHMCFYLKIFLIGKKIGCTFLLC